MEVKSEEGKVESVANETKAEKTKSETAAPLKEKKWKTMHIQSFFQVGLSKLEAEERRKKLFEAEEERERKIQEELLAKQRELEDLEVRKLFEKLEHSEQLRIQAEKQRIAEEMKKSELRREDLKTNHIGKLVRENLGLYIGSEEAASNSEWLQQEVNKND